MTDDTPPAGAPPSGQEPGASSSPAADGAATVTLDDRTGAGSPAANQGAGQVLRPDVADPPASDTVPAAVDQPGQDAHVDRAAQLPRPAALDAAPAQVEPVTSGRLPDPAQGGHAPGVELPGEQAAPGTSEQAKPVQGVRGPLEDDLPA